MPSFGDFLGLGALTSWLSGSLKIEETDAVRSAAEPQKRDAKHRIMQTITISSDKLEGKTFEQAMAEKLSSTTDSEETDELAGRLEAVVFIEKRIPDGNADDHSQTECEDAGGPYTMNAVLQNSSNHPEQGCQRCGLAYEAKYAVTKVMQAAGPLGLGSTESFDAIARVYRYSPSEMALRNFLITLISNLVEQKWIEFDSSRWGAGEYAHGTGNFSHVFTPHPTGIPVSHFPSGEKLGVDQPDGVCAGLGLVAMSRAMDIFICGDHNEDMKHKQLVKHLEAKISLLETDGTLLIIDVDKCDEDCSADSHTLGSPHEGLRVTGYGSKDVVKALEELGMEDITVIRDQHFLFEAKEGSGPDSPTFRKKETYFVLKAKRGPLVETRLSQA